MKRALTLMSILFGTLPGGAARADVPGVDLSASRASDDRVRIDMSVSYYIDELTVGCGSLVRRFFQGDPEGTSPQAELRSSGVAETDCRCGLRAPPDGPVPDATGLACTWEGTTSMHGTCPEPFFCHCTFTCEPVFDAPCNGDYRYEVREADYWETAHTAGLSVDWRKECPEDAGCGCAAAPTLPEALVVLIFLGAALFPAAWARRRRGRRPPPAS